MLKICIKQMLFWEIYQSISKSFHLFVVAFLCISAGWESFITPRRPIGVRWGTFTGIPLCFLLVPWDLYMTRSHAARRFFTAIRIRVKLLQVFKILKHLIPNPFEITTSIMNVDGKWLITFKINIPHSEQFFSLSPIGWFLLSWFPIG
jgi:hypothetical protein